MWGDRHFKGKNHQINLNDILTVVVALTNRQIKKQPLRRSGWIAPEWWQEIFEFE